MSAVHTALATAHRNPSNSRHAPRSDAESVGLATRTSRRQRNRDDLIAFLVSGRITTSLLAVVVTGFASGSLRLRGGGPFRNGAAGRFPARFDSSRAAAKATTCVSNAAMRWRTLSQPGHLVDGD